MAPESSSCQSCAVFASYQPLSLVNRYFLYYLFSFFYFFFESRHCHTQGTVLGESPISHCNVSRIDRLGKLNMYYKNLFNILSLKIHFLEGKTKILLLRFSTAPLRKLKKSIVVKKTFSVLEKK